MPRDLDHAGDATAMLGVARPGQLGSALIAKAQIAKQARRVVRRLVRLWSHAGTVARPAAAAIRGLPQIGAENVRPRDSRRQRCRNPRCDRRKTSLCAALGKPYNLFIGTGSPQRRRR